MGRASEMAGSRITSISSIFFILVFLPNVLSSSDARSESEPGIQDQSGNVHSGLNCPVPSDRMQRLVRFVGAAVGRGLDWW